MLFFSVICSRVFVANAQGSMALLDLRNKGKCMLVDFVATFVKLTGLCTLFSGLLSLFSVEYRRHQKIFKAPVTIFTNISTTTYNVVKHFIYLVSK